MKKILWYALIVLTIFVCGYGVGLLINGPEKAEAAYGCSRFVSVTCYNSGGPGDEIYLDIQFSEAMKSTGVVQYTEDKKTYFLYFMPK